MNNKDKMLMNIGKKLGNYKTSYYKQKDIKKQWKTQNLVYNSINKQQINQK